MSNEMRDGISLLAAIGNLSLAVTAAFAGRKSPLSRPLAALCFVLFGWNFSTLAHHLVRANIWSGVTPAPADGGTDAFEVLDVFFTALSPPLVLEVVLAFVGESRRHRAARVVAWVLFGGLATSSLVALGGSPAAIQWNRGVGQAVLFLSGYVPTLVLEVLVLGRYLRATTDVREKARARTVLAALAIGGSFSMSDIVRGGLGLPLPYLGAIGTLIAAGLLTTLVIRFELFDRNVSVRTAVYVLGMIVAFVVAYLIVFLAFAGRLAVQLFAVGVLTLLVAAVARELALSVAEARARTQRLAVLGRFSAQMAHDIKGPLTALIGSIQVLDGVAGDDKETQKEFLGLVSEQAKRIGAIVDRYDRMARVEPQKTIVRVNDLVRAVARAHKIPDDKDHLALSSADEDVECDADPALYESALENVVRNAVEAAKDAALVRIESGVDEEHGEEMMSVSVIDRGPGMDARVLERATEDFFTTKADGSGLGLAFVRRVLEAHGGEVRLTSQPGKGTTVELRIPRKAHK